MSVHLTHSISLVLFPEVTMLIVLSLHQGTLMPELQQLLRTVTRKPHRERNFSGISGFAMDDFPAENSIQYVDIIYTIAKFEPHVSYNILFILILITMAKKLL
jgi:hypothetical protein